MPERRVIRGRIYAAALAVILSLVVGGVALGGALPRKPVNAVGPTWINWLHAGNPLLQQNEPEGANSPNFPKWVALGANDYRLVHDPLVRDAWPGIMMSRDGGYTWFSGALPASLKDADNIGMKGGADPNLEAVPGMLFYNYMAFWRDGSNPGVLALARFYEHNREVGPPWEHRDTLVNIGGSSGRLHDKPTFEASLRNPDDGYPDIVLPIPAYEDPRNPNNSHEAYDLNLQAMRLHMCYTLFTGNDKNDGTQVWCMYSDDAGESWTKTKVSESIGVNQGASLAFRNFGDDVLVTWVRFEDNNETAAIMGAYSTTAGESFSNPFVVAEFCPFNQSTGATRPRTTSMPSTVSAGSDFAVYFASRNNADGTCNIPGKGSNPDVPDMADVLFVDDFDSYGEDIVDGERVKDGKVRMSRNFSRIMMVRGSGGNKLNWGDAVMVDPQLNERGRNRGHQFMVSCEAAGGLETCSYLDTRLDKLNNLPTPIAGPFVEDYILHLEPDPDNPSRAVSATVLPAGVYDQVPPPDILPPTHSNVPLRRTLDVFAFQVQDGAPVPYVVDPETWYPASSDTESPITSSPSVRVTRFAHGLRRDPSTGTVSIEQVEWYYSGARLFQKGKAPFISDYGDTFATEWVKRPGDNKWVSTQGPINPGTDFFNSRSPTFHVAYTTNQNVRGKVFYTGCDEWDPVQEMWVSGTGCASTTTLPEPPLVMLPLEGEDGTDGVVQTCSAAGLNASLSRNQDVYVAPMAADIAVEVVSAIKRPVGQRNTFVLNILNGTREDRTVRLGLPVGELVSFDRDVPDSLSSIDVIVPAGFSNARTVFDFANANANPAVLDQPITLTAWDVLADGSAGEVVARIQLLRSSQAPLENVQTNDDVPLDLVGDGEFFNLVLKREKIGTETAYLDLEHADMESSADLLDLEHLDLEHSDLENMVLFLDLEHYDLENRNLADLLYSGDADGKVLDLEHLDLEHRLLFLDLEHLDLEHLDLEHLDLEHLDLEHLDLEHLDLEHLDLEHDSIYASDVENLDLEHLDLEHVTPDGDPVPYNEISWSIDSANNTTTGVDVEPIFSESVGTALMSPDTQVLFIVRRAYLTPTVVTAPGAESCQPRVVAQNQVLYAAVMTAEQIFNAIFDGQVLDPEPDRPETPAFAFDSDQTAIVTLRVLNPPANLDLDALEAGSGLKAFAQAGGEGNCTLELGDNEQHDVCEVDFESDSEPPVITLAGANPLDTEAGEPFTDPGASAEDNADGAVPVVLESNSVDTSTLGTYSVVYSATDERGNQSTATRTVNVVDTTAPVITLTGPAEMTMQATADPFVDPGFAASDSFEGDLTGQVIITGSVDATVVGDYTLFYDVEDSSNNAATQLSRIVHIEDTTPPGIIIGDPPDFIPEEPFVLDPDDPDGTFTVAWPVSGQDLEQGLSISCSVVGSSPLIVIDPVNTNYDSASGVLTADFTYDFPVGTTLISCVVTDQGGNLSVPEQFSVLVEDRPVIDSGVPTVLPFPITANDPSGFVGPIASVLPTITASDGIDGTIVAECGRLEGDSILANDLPMGISTIRCIATDSAVTSEGLPAPNESEPVDFAVIVSDDVDPTITIAEDPLRRKMSLDNEQCKGNQKKAGCNYTLSIDYLANVSASDDLGGPVAITCLIDGVEQPSPHDFPLGITPVACTATDGSGNSSAASFDVDVWVDPYD